MKRGERLFRSVQDLAKKTNTIKDELAKAERMLPVASWGSAKSIGDAVPLDEFESNPDRVRARLAYLHNDALVQHFFETADGLRPAFTHVRMILEAVDDFFFGGWRDSGCFDLSHRRVSASVARGNQWWFELYRSGVLAASLLADGRAGERLAGWIGQDLQWYDEIVGMPRCEYDWYWHLAAWRHGQATDIVCSKLEELVGARLKRQRFLGLATQALMRDDGSAFCTWMNKLGEALLQQNYPNEFEYRHPSYEASILWHTARARGLPLPDLNAHVRKVPKFKIKRPGFVSPTLDATAADFFFFPDGIENF